MKLIIPLGMVLVLTVTMISSCTYRKEENYYPKTTCDTNSISYKDFIQPLMSSNCYVCHAASNALLSGGGYVLDTHTTLAAQAKAGTLYRDLSNPDVNNLQHMPRSLPSLPDCEILKVKAWINQGAQNN